LKFGAALNFEKEGIQVNYDTLNSEIITVHRDYITDIARPLKKVDKLLDYESDYSECIF
jgi:hypothetical protein